MNGPKAVVRPSTGFEHAEHPSRYWRAYHTAVVRTILRRWECGEHEPASDEWIGNLPYPVGCGPFVNNDFYLYAE